MKLTRMLESLLPLIGPILEKQEDDWLIKDIQKAITDEGAPMTEREIISALEDEWSDDEIVKGLADGVKRTYLSYNRSERTYQVLRYMHARGPYGK